VKYRNYTFIVYSRVTLGGSPFLRGQQKADGDCDSYILLTFKILYVLEGFCMVSKPPVMP